MHPTPALTTVWVELRRRGHALVRIAEEVGVSVFDVQAATAPFGPFPRDSEDKGIAWAQRRHARESTTSIAASAGVSHQRVSLLTRPFGPFPSPHKPTPDQVESWVGARRKGFSAEQIAKAADVPIGRVHNALRGHGPFPRRVHAPPPDGLLRTADILRRLGISAPTLASWQDFPQPIAADPHGRQLWHTTEVTTWAEQHLTTCPDCGARPRSLSHHRRLSHRSRALS